MANIVDMEHAMIQYVRTVQQYKIQKLTFVQFGDGWIFATLLRSAANFKIKFGDLIENCSKWTHRLANLKKIVALIQEYFEQQIKKGIKTKDVDLIEIAKNFNVEQILKMFSLVIAVLTQAPNKQDHINTIMSLDQKSQSAFVSIIQNLLEQRILQKNQTKQDKIFQTINHLQIQNNLLRNQVQSLISQNNQLDKQIIQLKHKQQDYQQQIQKIRDQIHDKSHISHQEPKEKQHMRNMIDNLKEKLIATVRDSQIKISGFKEEIHVLEGKCMRYEEIQEQLQDYKRRYNETIQSYGKAKLWEREKSKLMRIVQEKDDIIKKLNAKIDEANQLNYAMQERQVQAKMQLQRRDVHFKQLQKQVKKKWGSNNTLNITDIPKSQHNPNSNAAVLSNQINQIDKLQIQQLKNEIQSLKRKNRQSERENNRLKKNIQKTAALQLDKKKLERLILDLNNQKRQQVQVLLSTTYDFYVENQRLKTLLSKCGIVC